MKELGVDAKGNNGQIQNELLRTRQEGKTIPWQEVFSSRQQARERKGNGQRNNQAKNGGSRRRHAQGARRRGGRAARATSTRASR